MNRIYETICCLRVVFLFSTEESNPKIIFMQRSEGLAVDPSAAMANDTIYQVKTKYYLILFYSYVLFVLLISFTMFKTDPTATEHAEEVDTRVRSGDREDEANARTPLHQLLQTPSDIRWISSTFSLFYIGLVLNYFCNQYLVIGISASLDRL